MTGIGVNTGGPPTSNRGAIEAAMQPDPNEGSGPDADEGAEEQQLTEVESRIMRLEEALVSRGVLHDSDLQGPPVPAPGGANDPNAPQDPNAPADPAAQGAPPAPSGPPIQ